METTNTDRYEAWPGTELCLFPFVEYLFTISEKRRVKIVGIDESHVPELFASFLILNNT
jgi:hypothetical protein